MIAPPHPFRTGLSDETTGDLVDRLLVAIHEHAEAEHRAHPVAGGPTINGPLAIAALSQIAAELTLSVPPGRQRDELIAFREGVFAAVVKSASTGQPVDLTFVPAGAAH